MSEDHYKKPSATTPIIIALIVGITAGFVMTRWTSSDPDVDITKNGNKQVISNSSNISSKTGVSTISIDTTAEDVGMLVVKGAFAHLRTSHGIKYKKFGRVGKGELLYPTDLFNSWYRVRMPSGEHSWIAYKLVKKIKVSDSQYQMYSKDWPETFAYTVPDENLNWLEVTSSLLNVRTNYGVAYHMIDRVYVGDPLELLAKMNKWYKVRIPNGNVGWVYQKHVATHMVEKEFPYRLVRVRAAHVRLKSTHGTRFGGIDDLVEGEVLSVLNVLDGWIQVETPVGAIGWVSVEQIDPMYEKKEDTGASKLFLDYY